MSLAHSFDQWKSSARGDPVRRQRFRGLLGVATPFLLTLVLIAGCGGSQGTTRSAKGAVTPTATTNPKLIYQAGGPGSWNPYAQVTFVPSTSYATALRLITDLGLQPVNPCTFGASHTPWALLDGDAAFATLAKSGYPPSLMAQATSRSLNNTSVALYYVAAPDWPVRLSQLSAVELIEDRPIHCALYPSDQTPVPGRIYYLNPEQTPTYVRVTFGASTSYADALQAISSLGFRLADPCYEQSQPKPAWHPMGQEARYSSTYSLTVATTGANANIWQHQLASAASVTNVVSPYQPAC